ncbi:hypothetical protein V495_00065 [Pseudogymnoascus sp. VKM F-4514 (FW-929)]|nr:hypothetical protein V495_00065 [Pseudogymnoascus sp. VKM F-4514 (FW-929)]
MLQLLRTNTVLFFSDMAGSIGNFAIHDSLDTALGAAKPGNPDFDLYNNQKELRKLGQNMWALRSEWKSEAAWRLDKYKNLYTAQKAWDLAPDRDCHPRSDQAALSRQPGGPASVCIGDVLDVGGGVAEGTLDPTKPLYLGSQVDVGRPPFAHGGSGYLLSKPAMKLLVGDDRKALAKEFDKNATTACCGDQEIGRTLFKKGLKVQNVRPVINGRNPNTFNFGPELWCTPVVTMHHMVSEEVQNMWDFENQRNSTKEPLLVEELYYTMIASLMTNPRRDDWDNHSPIEQLHPEPLAYPEYIGDFFHDDPNKSYNQCHKACEKDPTCFQFLYSRDSCKLDTAFNLGVPRYPTKADDGEEISFQSGWMVERIQDWIKHNSPCPGPNWEKDH